MERKKSVLFNVQDGISGDKSEGDEVEKNAKDEEIGKVEKIGKVENKKGGNEDTESIQSDTEKRTIKRDSRDYQFRLSDIDLDYFNDLTNDEYTNTIEGVINEKKHLLLENRVFENFLKTNEPQLLAGLPQARLAIQEIEEKHQLMPPGFEKYEEPISVKTFMFSDKGARINISQRTDLVLRDVEEMQQSLDAFIQKANKIKFKYRAEIEESGIRGDEIKEAHELFEQSIVIDAVDPLTQRIPAEKFVWYMHEWLKSARLITEKLRLRNNSMKTQYIKLSALLSQKIDLGESIGEVDFEQLRIQNRHMKTKIDKKTHHLIELKRITGKGNLNLATQKSYLQKIQGTMNAIKNQINETVEFTQAVESEFDLAHSEVEEAEQNYANVKELIDNYKVPDVLDYIKTKVKLNDLNKQFKILTRHENIMKIIINSYIKKMIKLTGGKTVDPSWFQTIDDADELELFEDDEEKYLQSMYNAQKELPLPEFDIFTALKK